MFAVLADVVACVKFFFRFLCRWGVKTRWEMLILVRESSTMGLSFRPRNSPFAHVMLPDPKIGSCNVIACCQSTVFYKVRFLNQHLVFVWLFLAMAVLLYQNPEWCVKDTTGEKLRSMAVSQIHDKTSRFFYHGLFTIQGFAVTMHFTNLYCKYLGVCDSFSVFFFSCHLNMEELKLWRLQRLLTSHQNETGKRKDCKDCLIELRILFLFFCRTHWEWRCGLGSCWMKTSYVSRAAAVIYAETSFIRRLIQYASSGKKGKWKHCVTCTWMIVTVFPSLIELFGVDRWGKRCWRRRDWSSTS